MMHRARDLGRFWFAGLFVTLFLPFYREATSSIRSDLSTMNGPHRVVAVDAEKPCPGIDLGGTSRESTSGPRFTARTGRSRWGLRERHPHEMKGVPS